MFNISFCFNIENTSYLSAHEKELPYVCKVDGCGKAFTNSFGLKCHRQSIHENIWFYCDVCNQKFAEAKSMRNHKFTVHERQFRHSCSWCGKGFQKPVHLQTHLNKNHPMIEAQQR